MGTEISLDTPDGTLCNVCQVEVCFGPFRVVLVSVQDRCTVCIERTIGLEIILDAPNGTPR
jgi:hypothetical protein